MGLAADYAKLPDDEVNLATLNGLVVTAQSNLDAANAAVANEKTQIGTDTATVVADLQAAPYNGSAAIVDTSQSPLITITLLTVVPPTTPGGASGLAAQTITVAS